MNSRLARTLLLYIAAFAVLLDGVESFSPSLQRQPTTRQQSESSSSSSCSPIRDIVPFSRRDDAGNTIIHWRQNRCNACRIRWSRRFFKPDESVDLYGNNDDDDDDGKEEEAAKEEESDSERLEYMAMFLTNRLGRAYLRSKLHAMRQEAQTDSIAVTTTTTHGTSSDTAILSNDTKENEPGDNPSAETSIASAPSAASSSLFEEDVEETSSNPILELESNDEVDDDGNEARSVIDAAEETTIKDSTSVEDVVKPSVDADTKNATVPVADDDKEDASALDTTNITPTAAAAAVLETKTDTSEGRQSDDTTVEVPSVAPEKTDGNVTVVDETKEAEAGHEKEAALLNDGKDNIWTGIPRIPKEISLMFGRPLQVVQSDLPPLRS